MKTKLALAVSSLFVLYGCGGGGSESPIPLSPASTVPATLALPSTATLTSAPAQTGLKKSYLSQTHIDPDSTAYSHVAFYGTIIDDIDRDGFVDLVSFPSNGWGGSMMAPIVWRNQNGRFVSAPWLIKDMGKTEFVRELVSADFDGDGITDHMLIDIGHEHPTTGRLSQGGVPIMLKGTSTGLAWQTTDQWLTAPNGGRAFNHIAAGNDIDGDGDTDVIIATMKSDHKFRVYKNDGQGRFSYHDEVMPDSADTASGTGAVKTQNGTVVIAGFYRMFSSDHYQPAPKVYTQSNGKFVESYSLTKPNLGGRERNYGASDMFNLDVNGDGLEDLLITWETNSFDGIDDGASNMSRSHITPRYQDRGNSIMTVWIQNQDGRLVPDPNGMIYDLSKSSAGGPLKFLDFNNDGILDFYYSAYDVRARDFDSMVWINDGRGRFSNPQGQFKIDPADDEDRYLIPFFFDANRDGKIDVVAVEPVFEPGRDPKKTIGQNIRVFLSH